MILIFELCSSACPEIAVQPPFSVRRLGRVMDCIGRAAAIALTLLTLAPARAEGPVGSAHPGGVAARACLDQRDRQAAVETGKVVSLAAALRSAKKRMPGSVVRALLCPGKDGLVYVLTVLARDGKVERLTVDAAKGTLVGNR
jgi:hypothetical protein